MSNESSIIRLSSFDSPTTPVASSLVAPLRQMTCKQRATRQIEYRVTYLLWQTQFQQQWCWGSRDSRNPFGRKQLRHQWFHSIHHMQKRRSIRTSPLRRCQRPLVSSLLGLRSRERGKTRRMQLQRFSGTEVLSGVNMDQPFWWEKFISISAM